MPKGVEHIVVEDRPFRVYYQMEVPLMPKGVEHLDKPG